MADPAQRAVAVSELARLNNLSLQSVWAQAQATGIPMRIKQPDGSVAELVEF